MSETKVCSQGEASFHRSPGGSGASISLPSAGGELPNLAGPYSRGGSFRPLSVDFHSGRAPEGGLGCLQLLLSLLPVSGPHCAQSSGSQRVSNRDRSLAHSKCLMNVGSHYNLIFCNH